MCICDLCSFHCKTFAPFPGNPCASNPCMNGGMCASNKGHRFTCHCQQAWAGPTCNQGDFPFCSVFQFDRLRLALWFLDSVKAFFYGFNCLDVNECETDPCPVGSRCVNTRGSFSCECPLGFDLEDGRTCTRGTKQWNTKGTSQPQSHLFLRALLIHSQPFVPPRSKDISGDIQCEQAATRPCYLQEPHGAWDPERDHSAGEKWSTSPHGIMSCLTSIRFVNTLFLSAPQLNASLSVLRGYSRSILRKK